MRERHDSPEPVVRRAQTGRSGQPVQPFRSPTIERLFRIVKFFRDCATYLRPKVYHVRFYRGRAAMDYDLLIVGDTREGFEQAISFAETGGRVGIIAPANS